MFFSKVKENLKKTKDALDVKLSNVFAKSKDIDEIIDEIEETLILSDIGTKTSTKVCDNLRLALKSQVDKSEEAIKELLKKEMINILCVEQISPDEANISGKQVILVVGVNGVGKTTSIGKLTNLYRLQGKKILLAAADTFRAGAVEQLDIWAKRNNMDICMGKEFQDPASVIYDATKMFEAGDYDILICDTAGRLHNKKNLMDELEKIKRIIDKNLPRAKKEVLMVLDATTGQNGAIQVKRFFERTNVNAIFLTKLDSTSKGGVVFSIVDELHIPIKYIGIGEQIEDIEIFDANSFVDAIV
ncbi:MAG: signal recognition particle-docking protein FtsY [Clostridia bacterium]